MANYTVKQLHDGKLKEIPNIGGIYYIKIPRDYVFKILPKSEGRQYTSKGKSSEYTGKKLLQLQKKVETVYGKPGCYKSNILYIGQTSHKVGLRERLREYIGFRYEEDTKPHDGGRAIWQLEGNEDFIVEIEPCGATDQPEAIEHKLILHFKAMFGEYPFANWKS
ncbi:MAG: hypothetical protein J5537_00765 [Lachnospiraceae bacterium]|nr:hypothetical protein [Lachnospiraceae bacterium]